MAQGISIVDVSRVNDSIGQAGTAQAAFKIIDGLGRPMLGRVMDLNHVDPDTVGRGVAGRTALGEAHGWARPAESGR